MDASGGEKEPLLQGVEYPSVLGNAPELSPFRPLTSSQEGEGQLSEWAEGQYAKGGEGIFRTSPSVPPIESASPASINEIRAAASQDPYPQWIYGALVNPEASTQCVAKNTQDAQAGATQGRQQNDTATSIEQWVTEEESRELLTDYVGKHGCWGARPAHEWPISKIEDCNVYVGTLETFIEDRDVETLVKPYNVGPVDYRGREREPGPWEIDMRHEFPYLFIPKKEARQKIPSSESVQTCPDCGGRREVPCSSCNPNKNINNYVPGQTTMCPTCMGRGLLAHQDGSDTKCKDCHGQGKLPCTKCRSRGLFECGNCQGSGALLESKQLLVTWSTLKAKKISTSSKATLVPDEVFYEAKGVQLYSSEAYQCQPVSFPNSQVLTSLSSEVITERLPAPPSARVICERHNVHMIPVARVSVSQGKSSFEFYIVGLEKRVYIRNYPARPVGPGAVVGAAVVLSLIGGLLFLWKLTQKRRHSRQFITRV